MTIPEAADDGAWPYADPPETEVIVLGRVLRGESSLLLVTHDEDDGGWQFLDGGQVFEDDAKAVYLAEMLQFDPSIAQLADLPVGWYADRPDPSAPWERTAGEHPAGSDGPGPGPVVE